MKTENKNYMPEAPKALETVAEIKAREAEMNRSTIWFLIRKIPMFATAGVVGFYGAGLYLLFSFYGAAMTGFILAWAMAGAASLGVTITIATVFIIQLITGTLIRIGFKIS